jgi:hypothetical protein
MDIRVLNQLSGANSLASAVSVPVDTRAVLSEIANNTAMTAVERSGLISAVATVDSNFSGVERADALAQVQRLGIYLRNSGSDGFPKWPMMTALRAYGMNLTGGEGGAAQTSVVANLRGQLEQIAQGRGVSLEKAIAAATVPMVRQAPPVEVELDMPAPERGLKVETIA